MQTKHKVILGITAAVAIVVGGFVYSQGSSFQGALSVREDRDRDGMRDLWETQYGLNTASNDAASDLDGDGLTNRREYTLRTYPNDPDSDDDGLNDRHEVNIYATLPLDNDSDDGTVSDGDEVTNGTNPLDGSDDVAVSLPDLVANEAATTFSVSGEVFIDASGQISGFGDTIETGTCGIRNDGPGDASSGSQSSCTFYFDGNYMMEVSTSLSTALAHGDTETFSDSTSYSSGTSSVDNYEHIQSLYDNGGITLDVNYYIDYTSNTTESDESNNESSYTLTVDDSLITWTVQAEEEFGTTSADESEENSISTGSAGEEDSSDGV